MVVGIKCEMKGRGRGEGNRWLCQKKRLGDGVNSVNGNFISALKGKEGRK